MHAEALALLALVISMSSVPVSALLVVATMPSVAHDIELIACPGDRVLSIVPPGADVHEYQLGPSDLRLLREADMLVVMGGEALDEKLVELHREGIIRGVLVIVNEIEGMELLASPITARPNIHGTILYPPNYLRFMGYIAGVMSELNPECADKYRRNLETVSSSIAALPSHVLQGKKAILSSPVVQYAAYWLGVKVVGVIRDGVEAPLTLRDLEELRSGAREADLMIASTLDERLAEEAQRVGLPTIVVPFPASNESTLEILRRVAEAAGELDLEGRQIRRSIIVGSPLALLAIGIAVAIALVYLLWLSVKRYRY